MTAPTRGRRMIVKGLDGTTSGLTATPPAEERALDYARQLAQLRIENNRLRAALLHQIGGCCFCPECDATYALTDGGPHAD